MPTNIDPLLLDRLFRYDAESGKLYWNHRSSDMFADPSISPHHVKTWNTNYAGKEAFTITNRGGYKTGTLFGEMHLAHRVIWAIHTGYWPEYQIDHIDGNRSNNQVINLRQATSAENNRNKSSHLNSSSKYLGVSWHKKCEKWKSTIRRDGLVVHLGLFLDEDDAARAYDAAAVQSHGSFARLNFPSQSRQVA